MPGDLVFLEAVPDKISPHSIPFPVPILEALDAKTPMMLRCLIAMMVRP